MTSLLEVKLDEEWCLSFLKCGSISTLIIQLFPLYQRCRIKCQILQRSFNISYFLGSHLKFISWFILMFSLSGLISYTEYLFLLTILTSKYTASLYNSYVEFSFLTSRTWNLVFVCLSLKALGIELVRCLRELECLLYKHDNLSLDPSIQKKQAWGYAPVVPVLGMGLTGYPE